jgi:peptidyl-prolyl cis-trans isomerase C
MEILMNATLPNRANAIRLAGVALLTPLLFACGSGGAGKSSQVVATVNGREITVMQLNHAFETAGVHEVTPESRKRALESLTAEELLVQAALDNKIDRDASFVQALEQSKRQLLAQFFAERKVYPKEVITSTEISDYYKREPLLFAKRRKFKFTTFQADASDVTPAVHQELQNVNSVDSVRRVLEKHGIKYVTQVANVAPEQLPIDELDDYAKARVGDLFVNPQTGGSVLLMSVTSIDEDVPMTLERAKPLIEEYLTNARNRKAAEEYLARARASAQIVYTQTEADGTTVTQTTSTDGTAPVSTLASAGQ